MKNIDVKANKRFASVLAMLLATCVVIGLLSSTAIKLASATLLVKNSKLKDIPIIGQLIDNIVDQPVQPSPTPSTPSTPSNSGNTVTPPATQAPVTQAPTEAPKEETKAPETQAPTTQAPPATQAPETQAPETEAPETVDPQSVAVKQSILKNYKDVVARGKLIGSQPGFTKATYRSLDWNIIGDIFFGSVASDNAGYFVSEGDAKASPVVVAGNAVSTELCINNNLYACLLDANDSDAVSAAIKSATKEALADGTFKIVIVLNDEANPAPIKPTDKVAQNFTSTMFPVITGEQVRVAMDNNGVESVDITYTDCTVELIYKPATGEIVSLKQTSNYVAKVKDGYISAKGTVTEVSEYYNFVY